MKSKTEALAKKIEAMKAELKDAERAEREANEQELLRLVRRAGCMDEVTKWARQLVDQQRKEKRSAATGDAA
jgi:hypothetical protein